MQNNVQQLIEQVKIGSQEKSLALLKLANLGEEAVPSIIDAIRNNRKLSRELGQVLFAVKNTDMVPIFIDLLSENKFYLANLGFQGLSKAQDPRGLEPLLSSLSGKRPILAIGALGELGDKDAIPPLVNFMQEQQKHPYAQCVFDQIDNIQDIEIDETPLQLIIASLIALAKLGNTKFNHLLSPLINYSSDDPYSDAPIIRANAIKSLQYMVFPDIFSLLQQALNDDYYEVRLEAIDALFYLGLPKAINLLATCIEDENQQVKNNAIVRFQDLTSIQLENDTKDEIESLWLRNQESFKPNICYRKGTPLFVPNIFEELKTTRFREHLLQELKIISGKDFGLGISEAILPTEEILDKINAWWQNNKENFEVGHIYKYGKQQDIEGIL